MPARHRGAAPRPPIRVADRLIRALPDTGWSASLGQTWTTLDKGTHTARTTAVPPSVAVLAPVRLFSATLRRRPASESLLCSHRSHLKLPTQESYRKMLCAQACIGTICSSWPASASDFRKSPTQRHLLLALRTTCGVDNLSCPVRTTTSRAPRGRIGCCGASLAQRQAMVP